MTEASDELNKLLESLGIKNGDPLLKEDSDFEENNLNIEDEQKEEEEWCDSLNSDDIDVLKDYGTTPPRTERNRKQRERNAYCSYAVAAAKTFCSRNKHRLASRCTSLPLQISHVKDPQTERLHSSRMSFRQKKRSQDIRRSYERQCKLMVEEIPNDILSSSTTLATVDDDEEDFSKCESLPPIFAVKVPTWSRYMSVSSRKVGYKECMQTPRKVSTSGLPPDRVSFYAHMVGLLKYNSQEHSFQFQTQRSEEEVLYQQEINEMIWLEIQAWHAGQDVLAFDNFLIEQRNKVEGVYEEVMNFNGSEAVDNEEKRFEFTFKSPIREQRSFNSETASQYTNLFWSENCDDCSGCLSIWCERCRNKENEVLERVYNLLERVDYIHSLFPSSRRLGQFFPSWNDQEFILRYKALCLWFNVTTQLRFIIDILGRRLGHVTKDTIPWPVFPESKQEIGTVTSPSQSQRSRDSGSHSMEDTSENESANKNNSSKTNQQQIVAEEHKKKPHTPVVRFELELDDSVESSDFNFSTESTDVECFSGDHLCPPSTSGGLRRCSSDIFLEANPYRRYVGKLLRNKGMKKTLDKVAEVIRDVMMRTICIIEESHSYIDDKDLQKIENESVKVSPHPLIAFREELRRHPQFNWIKKFRSMELPYFHTLFLFLASIPLHMMRECLKLRLEQMPKRPSRMSIKQLMTEYKEGIKFAVGVRQKFEKWCRFLVADLPESLANNLEIRKCQAIEELDSNVKKMLEVYLEWLDQFILMLHRETHVAGLQRNFLQEEWCFVQSTCPHVTDGESLAATRFCNIACHMLCSVRDFLNTGLDDMLSDLQASALDDTDDIEDEDDDTFEFENDFDNSSEEGQPTYLKRKLVLRCRALQELIGEARERALRAIALAKMLKLDLEVAIEAKNLPEDISSFFDTLYKTHHVLVKGHSLKNLIIFVPESIVKTPEEILSILQIRVGESSDKYLILVNAPSRAESKWRGESFTLSLNADCVIALSRVQVSGLMAIVKDGSHLHTVRRILGDALKGVLAFSSSQIAPHKAVTQSLLDMKAEALHLCKGLERSLSDMEEILSVNKFFPNANGECRQLSHLVRDTLHQGFLFGFEYHKEALRLVSGRQRSELAPMLISLGRHWMKFVRAHYSSGRGNRPRWALPGFEFLILVCDPHNTSEISDSEFKTLRAEIEECREYIIGSITNTDSSSPGTPLMMGRPFKSQSSTSSGSHGSSHVESPSIIYTDSPKFRNQLIKSNQPSFDRLDEPDSAVRENPMECVRDAVDELERRLEEKRFRENLIGRVSEHNRDLIEIKPHTVSFSWHRGFKIGAGHFGKVYTAVNNNSGELMAMKVLPLQPNDHRSIKKVANELKTFERINHPNLVKYYGIEIHNDEMLMFMEYCDEGTLEALAASTEGLPEEIVRKYTRQLLSAVQTMHENGIVHRDIKGANIFLAKEGNVLKLGDFGCAVRIRGLQTEVNELSGIVGTHAYMAPEIFRSNEGHGRAADIWSVGCVVIEMLTGKRPWPQYDSSVQIMFQVGCGKSPSFPESLSEEGEVFLRDCFVHSPKDRATASSLLDYTFVKVEEEENMSLPLFSLNSAPSARRSRLFSSDIKA